MPPLPVNQEGCLVSLENEIDSNGREIAFLKSQQHKALERLEFLSETQQKLLKKLNVVKSEFQLQEINNLRAERQLLQPCDSGVFSEDDVNVTPSRVVNSGSSVQRHTKKRSYDDAQNNAHSVKKERHRLERDDHAGTGFITSTDKKQPSVIISKTKTAGESRSSIAHVNTTPQVEEITVFIEENQHGLELALDESDEILRAWEQDGDLLRQEWKKQLKEFNKRNDDWPTKARTGGCVRSTLFVQGKCHLTIENPGEYACRTCWNTNALCVAWDEDNKAFWLRPQLPAVRSQDNKATGPFSIQKFMSMRTEISRGTRLAHWEKHYTP